MDTVKKYGAIGAAIAVVSGIAGYLLPTPHAYSQLFAFVLGPAGAFAGYGLAAFVVARVNNWSMPRLVAIAAISLIGAIVCASLYYNLYWADPSPGLGARILHALLYGFSFAFFFFTARWAGLLLSKGSGKE
jgi:hypothetical protein